MPATQEYLDKVQVNKEEIIRRFNSQESITAIAESLGFDRNTLAYRLSDWGIRPFIKQNEGKYSRCDISTRLTSFDTTPLEQETEEGCYWLGFILADGSISVTNSSFELSLAEIDKQHLIKFRNFLKLSTELKYREKTKSYRILFRNQRFHDLMISKGIYPRKCKSPLPVYVPKHEGHFMRGLLDGDGCYCMPKAEPKVLRILISNTKTVVDYVHSKFGRGNIRNNKQSASYTFIFQTAYTVNTFLEKAPEWLKTHEPYYLDRKVAKLEHFCRLC